MNPKLSIGISFKNPGLYFEEALKSVFSQTFTEWELILIDDGSSDRSFDLAKSLYDPRVRVYQDGQSKGLNVRLNELVSLANAPYFFRMDADDIMHPLRLEKQYLALLKEDNNTVIGTQAYSIDKHSNVIGLRTSQTHQQYGFSARHSFIHPTVAASTAWFRQHPYSHDRAYQRCEDAELWCRTSGLTQFINLPEPLLFYRENGSFSFSKYLSTNLGLLKIIHTNYRRPFLPYLILSSKEIFKIIIFFIANLVGLANLLVKLRSTDMSEDDLQQSNQIIQTILQKSIPIH
jgi:glycosyltransferase involved in cell wall biosynthesis